MTERNSTIRAREIGTQLKRYREQAGYTQRGVGRKIALSPASICRIEDGTRTPSPEDVASLLTVYDIIGPAREALLAIAREAAERGWWQRHNPALHQRWNTLASLEARACTITSFELAMVPGLLQSPVYADAIMRQRGAPSDAEVKRRVDVRMARQQIMFKKDPVHVSGFIDESALYRMPGSPAVMHRQLDYLVHMVEKTNVILRVLPITAGPLVGEIGSFHYLRFTEAPSVVFATNWASDLYMEDEAEIQRYDDAVHWLLNHALDTGESARLITRLLGALEEHPDVHPRIDWPGLAEEQP